MVYPGQSQLDDLTQINLKDIYSGIGVENSLVGRWAARLLFYSAARQFAQQVVGFDENVGVMGLQGAAQGILPCFVQGLKVEGQQNLPERGPLLVVSNHPGMADTLILFATLPRDDLYIVGADRPFLQALPHVSQRMIYVPEDAAGRLGVVRRMIMLLQEGHAILTFPAGQIEPDPAVLGGAVESLSGWSESLAIFIRKVPQFTLVGAVISGVLAPQATFHPITRLRKRKKDREQMGACLQLVVKTLSPRTWSLTPSVMYLPPLPANPLAEMRSSQAILQAVLAYYRVGLNEKSGVESLFCRLSTPDSLFMD